MSNSSSPQSLPFASPLEKWNVSNASKEFENFGGQVQLPLLPGYDQYFMDTRNVWYAERGRLSASDDESLYRRNVVYGKQRSSFEKTADKVEYLRELQSQWGDFKATFLKGIKKHPIFDILEEDRDIILAILEMLEQDRSASREEIKEAIERLSLHLDEEKAILLYHAACYNYFTLIKLLITSGGIGPNQQDDKGNSALHWAVVNENYQSIEALLRCGAKFSLPNNQGRTPIDYAKEYKLEKFFTILDRLQNEIYRE